MSDVFMCYRHDDMPHAAYHLASIINQKYSVFYDAQINVGHEFEEKILSEIDKCCVFLCFVGPQFFKRIHQEDDFVRQEIKRALDKKKHIIPIRFDDAEFPKKNELPEDIQKFVKFNYQNIRRLQPCFQRDAEDLLDTIASSLIGNPESSLRRNNEASLSGKPIHSIRSILLRWLREHKWPIILAALASCVLYTAGYLSRDDGDFLDRKLSEKLGENAHPPISIGYQKAAYPLSYSKGNGAAGFMVDLCRDIAQKAYPDSKPEPVEITTANRISKLASNEVYVECSAAPVDYEEHSNIIIPVPVYSRRVCLSRDRVYCNEDSRDVIYMTGTVNKKFVYPNAEEVHGYDEMGEKLRDGKKEIAAFTSDILAAGLLNNAKYQLVEKGFHLFLINQTDQRPFQIGILLSQNSGKFAGKMIEAAYKVLNEEGFCKRFEEAGFPAVMQTLTQKMTADGMKETQDPDELMAKEKILKAKFLASGKVPPNDLWIRCPWLPGEPTQKSADVK